MRASPPNLLADLNREDWVIIGAKLLEREPDPYNFVQAVIGVPSATKSKKTRRKAFPLAHLLGTPKAFQDISHPWSLVTWQK